MNNLGKELLMLVPNVAILVGRLAGDPRISMETKITLLAAAAYFVSPIDLIPDFIPGLGQIDDLMALLLIVDGIVNHLDAQIVEEHWRGSPATLARIRTISRAGTRIIPEGIKRRLFHRRLTGAATRFARKFTTDKPNPTQTSA